MNNIELKELIESNLDLTVEQGDALYDLFLLENPEIFELSHKTAKESGDEIDGVDILVETYFHWISNKCEGRVDYELISNVFINRTVSDMTENFIGALT